MMLEVAAVSMGAYLSETGSWVVGDTLKEFLEGQPLKHDTEESSIPHQSLLLIF